MRKAFTLIELLVVIAIIAIWRLCFSPCTCRQQSGQTARCLAHQKELYAALMLYVQDYGDKTPNENSHILHKTAMA